MSPLALHFLAGLECRHLNAGCAIVDLLETRCMLLRVRLVMDGYAERKGARPNEEHKAGPHQDYWIIRGTLLWTHATLTYLPSSSGCLAGVDADASWSRNASR